MSKVFKKISKAFNKVADSTIPGYRQIHKNWTDIRTPLTYAAIAAAAAYTGGAALGLMGIGTAGLSGAAGAAAGASSATGAALTGAAAGTASGIQANEARHANEANEKIAKAQAQEELRLAGLAPQQQTEFQTTRVRRYSSQFRQNLYSREKSKKLNSSSSTLA